MLIRESIQVGDKQLDLEMGKVAKQALGSVMVRCGDSVVLATCCAEEKARPGRDFFPLMVEYRENYYAAGRFPGGFFKREGRLTTKETLVSRLIDRPLRPLFDEGFMGETQVTAAVISADGVHEPDILGMVGACAAVYLSSAPFRQPVSAVRIGLLDGEFVVNPNVDEIQRSDLDLVVAATRESIVMVEAGAQFVSEDTVVTALEKAHEEIRNILDGLERMAKQLNPEKWVVHPEVLDPDFLAQARAALKDGMLAALTTKGKMASDKALSALKAEFLGPYEEAGDEEQMDLAARSFQAVKEETFRQYLLEQGKRTDGRAFDEVRPLDMEVSFLPRAHGSALFTRGETQALATLTLGTGSDSQIVDSIGGEYKKNFMLHYNFPSFSVGEVRPSRGPGRREIGHGALAERALAPVVPATPEFPYTMRIVSDILESNGSSSMATVCGGTLALMDGGIPIVEPVAGVAMGLVKEGDDYAVLTDIQGAEDHYGDMDFKVAGTSKGITALQMDIKVKGIDREVMAEALEQARKARLFILGKMADVLPKSRQDYSEHAPKIMTIQLPIDKIRDVIGPGGKMIRSIVERTGCKIDISDDGRCVVASLDAQSGDEAKKMIEELIAVPEEGKSYLGKVTRITDFGAFVEILPGTEGLLHISEIANYRVRSVTDELYEGQEIMVKVLSVERNGKMRLSRKALLVG